PTLHALLTLSLHDALPISARRTTVRPASNSRYISSVVNTIYRVRRAGKGPRVGRWETDWTRRDRSFHVDTRREPPRPAALPDRQDRKSTRLNSSHVKISYA